MKKATVSQSGPSLVLHLLPWYLALPRGHSRGAITHQFAANLANATFWVLPW